MKNLCFVIVLVFMACQNDKKFDLAKVDGEKEVNKRLSSLGVSNIQTQKGYWELVKRDGKIEAKLNDSGSLSTIYSLKTDEDIKLFNFDNFNIQISTRGKIIESDDEIAFVNISLESVKTFEFLKTLKEKLGDPDQIINDNVFYDVGNSKVKLVLNSFDKKDVNIEKDEFDDEYLVYPLYFVWNIRGYIYKYTLFINEKSFSNDFK